MAKPPPTICKNQTPKTKETTPAELRGAARLLFTARVYGSLCRLSFLKAVMGAREGGRRGSLTPSLKMKWGRAGLPTACKWRHATTQFLPKSLNGIICSSVDAITWCLPHNCYFTSKNRSESALNPICPGISATSDSCHCTV